MSFEAQPAAVGDGAAPGGTAVPGNTAVPDDSAPEDRLARIEAALARLTKSAAVPDQPLVDIAAGLDDLHQELQAALAGLDRS